MRIPYSILNKLKFYKLEKEVRYRVNAYIYYAFMYLEKKRYYERINRDDFFYEDLLNLAMYYSISNKGNVNKRQFIREIRELVRYYLFKVVSVNNKHKEDYIEEYILDRQNRYLNATQMKKTTIKILSEFENILKDVFNNHRQEFVTALINIYYIHNILLLKVPKEVKRKSKYISVAIKLEDYYRALSIVKKLKYKSISDFLLSVQFSLIEYKNRQLFVGGK